MSDIVSTTWYELDAANLTANVWTVGQSLYLSLSQLRITNAVGAAVSTAANFGTNGIIGTLQEAPNTNVAGSRMVVRLNGTADQKAGVKRTLSAVDL